MDLDFIIIRYKQMLETYEKLKEEPAKVCKALNYRQCKIIQDYFNERIDSFLSSIDSFTLNAKLYEFIYQEVRQINLLNEAKEAEKLQNKIRQFNLNDSQNFFLDRLCYILFGLYFLLKAIVLGYLISIDLSLNKESKNLEYLQSEYFQSAKLLAFPIGMKFMLGVSFHPDSTAKVAYECIFKDILQVKTFEYEKLLHFYQDFRQRVEKLKFSS